mgnify:CR=1 FL=1
MTAGQVHRQALNQDGRAEICLSLAIQPVDDFVVEHQIGSLASDLIRAIDHWLAFVILSFILLALTGMSLKFANMPWAGFLARLLGGRAAEHIFLDTLSTGAGVESLQFQLNYDSDLLHVTDVRLGPDVPVHFTRPVARARPS